MTAQSFPIADPRHPGNEEALLPPEVGRLGMWVFLATEVLFFGGLGLAYFYGRTHWPQGFAIASRHTDVVLGTVNTALLLTSSAVIALAHACSEYAPRRHWAARLLWLTAALGIAFLAVKGVEYRKEWYEHLVPRLGFSLGEEGAELFFWLYFVMTGLHAVHLAIGIAGVSVFAWGCSSARPWARANRIEAMALYWHFVDVVWIFLYPMIYLVDRHS
ncbi:MAG TPA: cytochrome c oxidase subunit 3 [Ramlibacter sp.]|uniref:cytochrome c oxidase subunit 3 n=1 Tax=Ramlibacter sp. TaxID=1917967 RepID=UPI002C4571EA|nr:cytochrome c oxidase subunit 3 [Ramlibacter sp.]HVZ46316.1 cytochrome c oxidase subunit 3 [Ramlibacter sp.]